MDNDSGQDIPDGHPAIQVIEQTDATADASEAGSLTFRGKLLKITHSDKHKTSQECLYRGSEEFLLSRFFGFIVEPETTRYLKVLSQYIQGPLSQGVTAHDLAVCGRHLP